MIEAKNQNHCYTVCIFFSFTSTSRLEI